MKMYFDGTAEELATLHSLMTSGTALTKEMFMEAIDELKQVIGEIKTDFVDYIANRDAVDATKDAALAAAVANAKDAMDKLSAEQANEATLQAAKDALTASVNDALQAAKDARDAIKPPSVVTPPVADPAPAPTPDPTPAPAPAAGDGGASTAPAGSTPVGDPSMGSGDAGTVASDPAMGGDAPVEVPVVAEPTK